MRRLTAAVTAAIVLLGVEHAGAQQSLQVPIQFDFLNPGARSLGMGSAFVAVADDATAAWTNPAGLVTLAREVSVEGRYQGFQQPFLFAGRLSGLPTGIGEDILSKPDFVDIDDSTVGLTFASFVQPFKQARIAFYRHELINVDQGFDYRGVFQNQGFDTRDTAFSADRSMHIDNYGLSVGWPWGPIRLGAGISAAKFSLGLDFARFAHESFRGAPDPSQVTFRFSQDGDAWSVGATVGALVPLKGGTTTIGAAYRLGPSFPFSSVARPTGSPEQTFSGDFKVPDVLALGVSTRPFKAHDEWLFAVEYKWVQNSQIKHDYIDVITSQGESAPRADRFTIADSNEIHVGAEYSLPVLGNPTVLGGFWYDPDHSVRYEPTSAGDLLDERMSVSLSSGTDLWHYTFGVGFAFSELFEWKLGADLSSRSNVFSTSAIIRFKKTGSTTP